MNLTSGIGIAVSGCKNGYAVLATDNIDVNSPLLKQSLRDQRSFLRVSEPGHDYFSIVITSKDVVYTAYRSSVDSVGSSGGFIAVSIFVPVSINLTKGATLLSEMLNAYWSEYMHPMFGNPLKDKFENTFRLREILNSSESCFSNSALRYKVFPSVSSLPPLFMEYGSAQDVDAVMANPLHKQYSQGCELLLVPRGFMSRPFVDHNLENIRTIEPLRSLPQTAICRLIVPADAPVTLENYKVNGVSYSSPSMVSLTPESVISVDIVMPDDKRIPMQGEVRSLIGNSITKKNEDYILRIPRISVTLSVSGCRPDAEYALSNGNVKSNPGVCNPDGTITFRVPCKGFPYNLVQVKNERTIRTLARNVVNVNNITMPVIPVSIPGVNPGGKIKGGTGKKHLPDMSQAWIYVTSALVVVLLVFLFWLFFLRSSDSDSDTETEKSESVQPAQPLDKNNPGNTEGKEEEKAPEYVYIILPISTLNEVIDINKDYDFVPVLETGEKLAPLEQHKFKAKYVGIDLKLPVEDAAKVNKIEIHNIDGTPHNTLEVTEETLLKDNYEDFKKIPNNKNRNYLIKPKRKEIDLNDIQVLLSRDLSKEMFELPTSAGSAHENQNSTTSTGTGNNNGGGTPGGATGTTVRGGTTGINNTGTQNGNSKPILDPTQL